MGGAPAVPRRGRGDQGAMAAARRPRPVAARRGHRRLGRLGVMNAALDLDTLAHDGGGRDERCVGAVVRRRQGHIGCAPAHEARADPWSEPSGIRERSASADVVVLEALDVALVEVAEGHLEQPSRLLAGVAHAVRRPARHPDGLAGLGGPRRSSTVMSIGTSRTCHISPRWSCRWSESRWPGWTVMILTVTCSLETNCWKAPHGRSATKMSSVGLRSPTT